MLQSSITRKISLSINQEDNRVELYFDNAFLCEFDLLDIWDILVNHLSHTTSSDPGLERRSFAARCVEASYKIYEQENPIKEEEE